MDNVVCVYIHIYNVFVEGKYMAVWRRGVGRNYDYDSRLGRMFYC